MTTALITGASSGIGRALAERFAARGATIALAARRRDMLDEVARSVVAKGGRAHVYELDVADTAATVATVNRAWDDLGGLDLVVANAGFGAELHAMELTWERAAPLLQVNVMGTLATLTTALSRMATRGSGHLVGVSSLAGRRGLPRSAVYSAAKAAISTFLEGIRVDLGGSGIAVTDVRPGFVDTDATRGKSHPMPFKLELEPAVDIILAGIDAKAPVVAFPLPLTAALAGSRLLPLAAYDALVRRLSGSERG